ncbi:MAG: hypothetical protein MJ189_05785, partial [Coriobacteriales bacterium]|nr:hypothetical protein [Coriobacteriales bacterium]
MSCDIIPAFHNSQRQPTGVKKHTSCIFNGIPGSGKSCAFASSVLEILKSNTAAVGQINPSGVIIINPKQVGFESWENLPMVRVYNDINQIPQIMQALVDYHSLVTSILVDRSIDNINGTELPYYYVMFDEASSIIGADSLLTTKSDVDAILTNLNLCLKLGRASGLVFYL